SVPANLRVHRRRITRREREDRVPSSGDACELESTALIRLGAQRTGRIELLRTRWALQQNGHIARRLPIQFDLARDNGRFCFCRFGLRLNRNSETERNQ